MKTSAIPAPTTHVVVMGVSGSGKTTLAGLLGTSLGCPVAEADEFHPAANIAKMSSGTPLTDEDRWPWLAAIRDWMGSNAEAGTGSVVTCSALKREYRDLLRQAPGVVRFIHVTADTQTLTERMDHRSGHFMPATLLPSQLQTLEPLEADEDGLTLVNNTTPEDLAARALAGLGCR
jgi:gluconokinase